MSPSAYKYGEREREFIKITKCLNPDKKSLQKTYFSKNTTADFSKSQFCVPVIND